MFSLLRRVFLWFGIGVGGFATGSAAIGTLWMIPSEEYTTFSTAGVEIDHVSWWDIDSACRERFGFFNEGIIIRGCAQWYSDGSCEVILPNRDEISDTLYAVIKLHELGHCNGWHNHAFGRWWYALSRDERRRLKEGVL